MSSHKSHKHSRDREGDGDHKRSRHGPSYSRDGSRDDRDREPRGPSWREADARQQEMSRDSKLGSAPGSNRTTPTKPPAPRPGGTVLGGSALSNAIMEAAKRRAQEQAAAAAAAEEEEEGEAGGARKKAKYDDRAAADREPSQPESLQERLQREAAEFRQLQHESPPEAADEAAGRGRPYQHRAGSRGSSRSSSPEEGQQQKPGGRWQIDDEEVDAQQQDEQQDSKRGRQQQGADDEDQQRQQKKSRWVQEDEDAVAADIEEGEAPLGLSVSAAVDEELEELNRRERAELEAGSLSDDDGGGGSPVGLSAVIAEEEPVTAGIPYEKNMLEESRRVEEYERLNRISEGTYGVVHRARCKATGKIFALKKLKLESFQDGFPQTSVRELNVLLSLHHQNIVNVSEVVIGARNEVYMVMEYVEHDLKYVLELQHKKKAPQFSIGQVKCLMHQLLEGVAYLHDSWVLHRDLKTSNLLYSNEGQLKICDMGLARQYGDPLRPFTPQVVTLWYRSIERLLGDPLYSTALDMWSVGCIMAELILCEPLFQGRGELDQMKKIFQLLGTPKQENWPGWDELPDVKNLQFKPQESQLRSKFPAKAFGIGQALLTDTGFDLLSRLLEMNPAKRITAAEALKHPWFEESPRPVSSTLMPTFPARHAQGGGMDVRDKVAKPSPGAVLPAGFGL